MAKIRLADGHGPGPRFARKIAKAFPEILISGCHVRPVGPPPEAMYQVVFDHALFDRILPFLAIHRDELAILIHADSTDDHAADHN